MSPTSPTPLPSTNTLPTWIGLVFCALFAVSSRTSPSSSNKAVFFRHAHVLGQAPVAHEMAILAVDRHEIARPGELQHRLKLFLARVTGNVDLRNFFVVHLGAAPIKVIDQIGNRFLVAGNELGGKNHGVAGLDLDGLWSFKATRCSTESGSPWLPVVRKVRRSSGRSCQRSFSVMILRGKCKIAQFRRDLAVSDHAAPAEHDAPAATLGNIDDLLNPRDAR